MPQIIATLFIGSYQIVKEEKRQKFHCSVVKALGVTVDWIFESIFPKIALNLGIFNCWRQNSRYSLIMKMENQGFDAEYKVIIELI